MGRFTATSLRSARLRAPRGSRIVRPSGSAGTAHFLPPVGGWQRQQQLSVDAAALIASLGTPRRLDPKQFGARALARMVLDGLLECDFGDGYRSGGSTHQIFFSNRDRPLPTDHIGRLSADALHLAATYCGAPPVVLADHLYHYNTNPSSPTWRRRFPDDVAVAVFHALHHPDIASSATASDRFQSGPWQVWSTAHTGQRNNAGPTWKLYLSPTPEHTARSVRALAATLGGPSGPFSMKVGRTVASSLRPDRIVAYFSTPQHLERTAARLGSTLGKTPAQGVPFTAALGDEGLLSWGADFPSTDDLPELGRERSWRGWLTVRLASALAVALASAATDPVACALDRVSLDGVDTERWKPEATLLQAGAAPDHIDADH